MEMPIRDSRIPLHWYQLSIVELILATAVVAVVVCLSAIRHDIGSGFSIVVYGFPLPFITNHSASGISVDGFALISNVVLWILSILALIITSRRFQASLSAKQEPNGG